MSKAKKGIIGKLLEYVYNNYSSKQLCCFQLQKLPVCLHLHGWLFRQPWCAFTTLMKTVVFTKLALLWPSRRLQNQSVYSCWVSKNPVANTASFRLRLSAWKSIWHHSHWAYYLPGHFLQVTPPKQKRKGKWKGAEHGGDDANYNSGLGLFGWFLGEWIQGLCTELHLHLFLFFEPGSY